VFHGASVHKNDPSSSKSGARSHAEYPRDVPVSPTEVSAAIDEAMRMTGERLAGIPASTVRDMLASIRNQLRFMRETIDAGRLPTIEEKNRLTLGVIAVRELETTDPEYCDAITRAAFAFKQL
jgi:hypothetical protein